MDTFVTVHVNGKVEVRTGNGPARVPAMDAAQRTAMLRFMAEHSIATQSAGVTLSPAYSAEALRVLRANGVSV